MALLRLLLTLPTLTTLALVATSLTTLPLAALAKSPPAPVVSGLDGWFFLGSELRFLQQPTFWGKTAPKTARSPKPEHADPLPAIVHFKEQLQQAGIELLLVPVPPKAALYPDALDPKTRATLHPDALDAFYRELAQKQIRVLDLRPLFAAKRATSPEPLYCKTDSHWSGHGCVLAAEAIAEALRADLLPLRPAPPLPTSQPRWIHSPIQGDLAALAPEKQLPPETLALRQIDDASGTPLQPNPASPLLLLGDSHALVFHEFLGERAGLLEQLTHQTGLLPDLIATRGSGATAVRVTLLRRSIKDPTYLASKKIVVWCFAAREFTEADQGWQPLPIRR